MLKQLPTFLFNEDNVNQKQSVCIRVTTQVNSSCPITQLELNAVLLALVDDTPIVPPPQLNAWLADTQDTPLAYLLLLIAKVGVLADQMLWQAPDSVLSISCDCQLKGIYRQSTHEHKVKMLPANITGICRPIKQLLSIEMLHSRGS